MKKIWLNAALFTATLLLLNPVWSATTYHRVVWDSDPAHNAVIAFSPSGTSTSPYVKYGFSTNEAQWQSQQPASSENFQSGLVSYFVRLTNLTENAPVYYRVCDNSGCGERFWFKTAPTDNQSYTVVAGGDSRTGLSDRRRGNSLVAKIRPLFIMHGGDYTNANNATEMSDFLADWALTYSADTIDGIAYKRIYPLVPTHGNHEDNNYRTLCQVFGVDFNGDHQCTTSDTYGAFNVSPLLRVYTLNTQYTNSGWSSFATAMNNWLAGDLNARGTSATWRIAQYHKPMFPHYTGKPDNPELFTWWAAHFYNYAMNVVVESDTHINKLTRAIRPQGSSFEVINSGGTVYVGEGSWGAPARSADQPRPWTIDLASVESFNVISVTPENLKVRTAQFDESASSLTRMERENNPLVLPTNVNWWIANGVGETMTLVRNAAGQSMIEENSPNTSNLELSASDDTFITTLQPNQNFNGSSEGLLADGSDTAHGAMETLVKWNMSAMPECSTILGASIRLDVFNPSAGSYQILAATQPWTESSATWNSVGGSANHGVVIATFTPSVIGMQNIALSSQGIEVVKNWLKGANNGVVIYANGSTDGIDVRSKEMNSSPKLIINYQENTNGCGSQMVAAELPATQDTFVSTTKSTQNFNGSSEGLLADGSDATYGSMNALVKWDLGSIPSCAIITSAKVQLNITNASPGAYQIRKGVNAWTEQAATWSSIGGTAHQGTLLTSFTASTMGLNVIDLTSVGVSAVQSWLQGANNGVVIISAGTTDGIDFTSKEMGNPPKLLLNYQLPAGCQTQPVQNFSVQLQAENYSASQGVQVETTSDAGGGQNVGWIDTGDWMAYYYITIPTSGNYTFEYRVASPNTGGVLSVDLNGGATPLGNLTIPNTGGWQNWTTISHSVALNAGTYNLGIYAQTGGWNMNWWSIKR